MKSWLRGFVTLAALMIGSVAMLPLVLVQQLKALGRRKLKR